MLKMKSTVFQILTITGGYIASNDVQGFAINNNVVQNVGIVSKQQQDRRQDLDFGRQRRRSNSVMFSTRNLNQQDNTSPIGLGTGGVAGNGMEQPLRPTFSFGGLRGVTPSHSSNRNNKQRRIGSALSMARTAFADSLKKAVKWTRDAADRSASIYMDPATQKIATVPTISWEPKAADAIRDMQQHMDTADRPFMVGVVGIPGSGKSTSCDILSSYLGNDAIVMPMDGYHLPMSTLEQFDNSVDMIYRRGAPDTFDPASLKHALDSIVHSDEDTVSMPGFDHAKGDPEPNQHTFVRSDHQIVICEGIYLMHDDDGWEDIKNYFDHTIYIAADVDKCIDRLKERNKCIPGYTAEEIEIRCDAVDRVNALMVEESRQFALQEVKSCAS